MSPPPHREKDAKVEGRDPSEKAKETMRTFRALTKRLLNVPIDEVKEQQALYESAQAKEPARARKKKNAGKRSIYSPPGSTENFDKPVTDENK